MQTDQRKSVINKFPLRLMPSVRRVAEEFSQKEGVSLNQFINIAVAEKLVHLQHEAWLAAREKPSASRIARALAILDQPTGIPPEPWDELPEGYESIRNTEEYKEASGVR
jgi:hypothetical protein